MESTCSQNESQRPHGEFPSKRPRLVTGKSRNLVGLEDHEALTLRAPGKCPGLLPRQSNRDGETEDPPPRDRGPAPSSGSRKQGAGLASPQTPNSMILEAPQDGGEDGGRGVSGLFQGGGDGGAGPRR